MSFFHRMTGTVEQGGVYVPPVEPNYFIFEVKTDNAGTSASDEFTLPLSNGGIYNMTVDWGDGNTDIITVWNQSETTHTYSSSGTYTIKISGICKDFHFLNIGDKLKILDISQWGILELSIANSFYGCSNLDVSATDAPTVSLPAGQNCFRNCSSLTNIGGNWDMSSVSDISAMFSGCSSFNQDIGSWDISNVTNMQNIFNGCSSFNQDIGSWDVSNATLMNQIFQGCTIFDQDISGWNPESATNMNYMFRSANAFDQDIGGWDITSVTSMTGMFGFGSGLSTTNYDALLVGWESQLVQNNVDFHGGSSQYSLGSPAETARTNLINDHSWTITDGGGV